MGVPPMLRRSIVAAAMAVTVSSSVEAQAPTRWTVDPTPLVTIGESQADTNDMFAEVTGATRLPDGHILVGDHGSFALKLFSADGRFVRRFGRKGAGPGEIGYLAALLRCGDSLVTIDIDGHRTSVFSLGGGYVRSFRFSSAQPGRSPYRSACNRRGDFAHYGWENFAEAKGGAYRSMVPLWLSRTDSGVRQVISTIPGSERFGQVVENRLRGTRPLPLGKQTAIAIGGDRIYVATGERYEILVFDFAGKQLEPMRDSRVVPATTRADIDYLKRQALARAQSLEQQARIERSYAEIPFPKTLPAYSVLLIDGAGQVWAQDDARAESPTTNWTIFDSRGRRVAAAALPVHFEVYEIGSDYVLGRFMDPDEAIPQVRLYRLRRGR